MIRFSNFGSPASDLETKEWQTSLKVMTDLVLVKSCKTVAPDSKHTYAQEKDWLVRGNTQKNHWGGNVTQVTSLPVRQVLLCNH